MKAPPTSKEKLLDWVNDQQQLDPTSKFILYRFAQFADADACAWSKVETLAYVANVSPRTVQLRIRRFEEDGLLARTGRMHDLPPGKRGVRQVPIYQLAPRVEGLGAAVVSGENPAPETAFGVKEKRVSGEAAFTPHKETEGTEVRSNDLTGRERAREARFDEADGAYPQSGRSVTDYPKARQAWVSVTAEVDPDALIAAIRRYGAEDRTLRKGDHGAPGFEKWLVAERWRAWLDHPVESAKGSAGGAARSGVSRFAGPAELRVAFADSFGEGAAGSWLDPCGWDGEGRVLLARTGVAASWLRSAGGLWLRKHGLRVEHINENASVG